jgi:hypothetical protein
MKKCLNYSGHSAIPYPLLNPLEPIYWSFAINVGVI